MALARARVCGRRFRRIGRARRRESSRPPARWCGRTFRLRDARPRRFAKATRWSGCETGRIPAPRLNLRDAGMQADRGAATSTRRRLGGRYGATPRARNVRCRACPRLRRWRRPRVAEGASVGEFGRAAETPFARKKATAMSRTRELVAAHLILGPREEPFLPALLASIERVADVLIVNDNG